MIMLTMHYIAFDVAGRPRLRWLLYRCNWYIWCSFGTTWWQPRLLVGFPFVSNNGVWPPVPTSVGNEPSCAEEMKLVGDLVFVWCSTGELSILWMSLLL
jgi:hypothetical protein